MKVAEVMSKKIEMVAPETRLPQLWQLIFKKRIHAIPVVDAKGKLLGIVAEEDLLKPLYPDYEDFVEDFVSASDFEQMEERIHDLAGLTAEKLMNRRIIFTRKDTPIMRALSRMIVRNVRLLPVLSETNIVLGVVSKGDIFDCLFKKHLKLVGLHQKLTKKGKHK